MYDQRRDQCMIPHLMGVWSVTWPVHGSYMIIAWSAKWVVHDSHVITAWQATWAMHDSHVISAWSDTHWILREPQSHPPYPGEGSRSLSFCLTFGKGQHFPSSFSPPLQDTLLPLCATSGIKSHLLFGCSIVSCFHQHEKTLQMDITRWSTPKSDWLYSLQPEMEKLYTVSKNKTRSWLWLRSWTPYCQIQTDIEESGENH